MIKNYNFSQEKGDRKYELPHDEVTLYAETLRILQTWNKKYPTVLYDAKYLKKLAVDVFGEICLKKSSVFGFPARNATVQHEALDAAKLNFVRGSKGVKKQRWTSDYKDKLIVFFSSQIYMIVVSAVMA